LHEQPLGQFMLGSERHSAPHGLRRRTSRVQLVFALVLRLFAISLSAEVSGAAHAALDLASSLSWLEHGEHAGDDDDDHECPPGCMNCHCAHAALTASALAIELHLELVPPIRIESSFPLRDALPLRSADLARLDRPPRSLS
jgi:hypothetical protein